MFVCDFMYFLKVHFFFLKCDLESSKATSMIQLYFQFIVCFNCLKKNVKKNKTIALDLLGCIH